MSFREILGQENAIGLIKQAFSRDRIPQAWLFVGQKSVGKYKTAVALTQYLNCRMNADDACGKCDFCIQIVEQNFMDFQVLSPEGNFIKIDQIRKSINWLNLHSDQSKTRVMILNGAQFLGKEAANAFLKTLEEPTPNTILILIAESLKQLQETIVSRCQTVMFNPLSEEISRLILRKNTELSSHSINLLGAISMGSLKVNLASRIELIEKVHTKSIDWLTKISTESLEEMLQTCESWGKSKNEEWSIFLEFLEIWFRDLVFILSGFSQKSLINAFESPSGNRITQLTKSSSFFCKEKIQEIFNQIVEVRKSIGNNANKSLALESLCLYIYRSTL